MSVDCINENSAAVKWSKENERYALSIMSGESLVSCTREIYNVATTTSIHTHDMIGLENIPIK